MERKKRNLDQISKQIIQCKSLIQQSQGHIASQINKFSTPQKNVRGQTDFNQTAHTTPDSLEHVGKQSLLARKDDQMANYIKNLKRLCASLQQKQYVIEAQNQKALLKYQYELDKLKKDLAVKDSPMEPLRKQIAQKDSKVKLLSSKNEQLQKLIKQKQTIIIKLNEDLSSSKKENTTIKLQNKTFKVDNKVIMNHIDRLTSQLKNEPNKKETLQQRQLRVMKSLYQDPQPNIQYIQATRRYDLVSNISNKVLLDDATDRNGDLKSLIRRLNQEIQILKREKQMLAEECKQKTLNFQSQKMIVKMGEVANDKLTNIITKMGEKIMSLQQLNETLRIQNKKLEETDDNVDENYYRQTKAKAGQFYYKR